MRRIPLILTLAALGAVGFGNASEPAGAMPSRSTTIAVKAAPAPIQDATTRRRPRRFYSGARPKNPDQIVENMGIDLPAQS